MDPQVVSRVVGVDINPAYLDVVAIRYSGRFKVLELCSADISQAQLKFEPVELVYAALVFEYVDVRSALRNLHFACQPDGHLVTLLQLPSVEVAAVTPTAFTSIRTLSSALKFVDPLTFQEMARDAGFALQYGTRATSVAGKEFALHVFQRSAAAP